MAQSRAKRRQRTSRPVPTGPTAAEVQRARTRRRIVIAFLILIGLAGILAISPSNGDGDGAPPAPGSWTEPAR